MPNGGVLSRVYNFITWDPYEGDNEAWYRYISDPENYKVGLKESAPLDELSDYEVEVLDKVFERFGHMNRRDLVKYMHGLPEWVDPHGSAVEVDIRVILSEAGKSDEEIREISDQAEAVWTFRTLLASAE